jgi:dihydropteroate synthase
MHGSVAAAVVAVMQGAAIIRAHDVGPTVEAVKVAAAVRSVAY